MSTLTLLTVRGGHVEGAHPIHAVAMRADGTLVHRTGAPHVTTWRSAAKPFQLEVSLGLLGDAEQLSDAQIAVGSSSHHGEPGHVAVVQGLLDRYGLTEAQLFCGAHAPMHVPSANALIREGQKPCALHNNCSGKHTFMAAGARRLGAPDDYRPVEHPLQQRILANVQDRTGGAVVDTVVDGCGVPCFVLSIDGMARAWATLAADMTAKTGPLSRIGHAMRADWWHASGTVATDGELMRVATSPLVAKVGAEGLMCIAIPDEGVGVVVKAESGNDKARAMAVHAVLARWYPGLIPAELATTQGEIKNWVGLRCGSWEARWS